MWRGNDVGYSGVHQWVRRHLPKPESCESCGRVSKWIDLANITGIYSREFENWRYLCRKCHRKNDGPTHIRDMSGFRCCICGSEKTVIVKQTGRPHWRYLDGKPICQTCYGRILKLRNKK